MGIFVGNREGCDVSLLVGGTVGGGPSVAVLFANVALVGGGLNVAPVGG